MSHRTDFMRERGYGVFFHYLNAVQNNAEHPSSLGRHTSWDECVAELDAEKLAEEVASTGAGWMTITVLQQWHYMIAPNATFDRVTGYKPGEACARRDLIGDLAHALEKRGVALFLYFTGDGPFQDEQAARAFGADYPAQTVSDAYFENWLPVLREYSATYGKSVRGWWMDGCYPPLGYDGERCRRIAEAARTGNPDAAVAINYYGCGSKMYTDPAGIIRAEWYLDPMPPVDGDDYTAGEANILGGLPVERFVDGAQWHLLSFLGAPRDYRMTYDGWGAHGMKYDPAWLRGYVGAIRGSGGVITLDAALLRDGSMLPDQLAALRGLAR